MKIYRLLYRSRSESPVLLPSWMTVQQDKVEAVPVSEPPAPPAPPAFIPKANNKKKWPSSKSNPNRFALPSPCHQGKGREEEAVGMAPALVLPPSSHAGQENACRTRVHLSHAHSPGEFYVLTEPDRRSLLAVTAGLERQLERMRSVVFGLPVSTERVYCVRLANEWHRCVVVPVPSCSASSCSSFVKSPLVRLLRLG